MIRLAALTDSLLRLALEPPEPRVPREVLDAEYAEDLAEWETDWGGRRRTILKTDFIFDL